MSSPYPRIESEGRRPCLVNVQLANRKARAIVKNPVILQKILGFCKKSWDFAKLPISSRSGMKFMRTLGPGTLWQKHDLYKKKPLVGPDTSLEQEGE